MAAAKNPGGRPPKYKNKEEIEGLIDKYFEDCEGTLLTNPDTGEPMIDKWGNPIYTNRRPPTITGLALALGFATRKSLMDYQGKKEFMETILRAKSRVEMYTEERLFDKDGSNGAKFSLQYNFKGWRDERAEDGRGAAVNIICDIPKVVANGNTDTAVFNPLMKLDESEQQTDEPADEQ